MHTSYHQVFSVITNAMIKSASHIHCEVKVKESNFGKYFKNKISIVIIHVFFIFVYNFQ